MRRYRCSSSGPVVALLLALALLAGCGGNGKPSAFPDPSGPLDVHTTHLAQGKGAVLDGVSFRGAGGKVVHALLAFTRRSGRHPAVLFLTGSGGSMSDFLTSDVRFAQSGGVGMSIQQPSVATSWAPLVENVRRALDLLVARSDVDASRLGVAGLSLGADTAAIVGGVDPRPHVFALMSARGGPVVVKYLELARGSFYVQDGLADLIVPRAQLHRAIDAIHGSRRVKWYDAPHTLNAAAFRSQLAWLRSQLHPAQ
ncbi:MAG TPA: hypothetical protein VFA37_04085 [Gaiellaceae bacterium]|nr:hypothetical protein [Gaiellaceae bacterium]